MQSLYISVLCALQFQLPLTSIVVSFSFHYPQTHTIDAARSSKMTLVQPSGEMSAKIREELREPDPAAVEKDVAAIREWLEKQPHLPKDMGAWDANNSTEPLITRLHNFRRWRTIAHVFAWLQIQFGEGQAEARHVLHNANGNSRILLQPRCRPSRARWDSGYCGYATASWTHAKRLPGRLSARSRPRKHAEQRCGWNEIGAYARRHSTCGRENWCCW